MKRSELSRPVIQYVLDWNSKAAHEAAGDPVRAYPRLLPVPFGAFNTCSEKLTLQPWRKNLRLYPQLWAVVGRDVEVGEEERARDAVAYIGLGIALLDDAILSASPDPIPRDVNMCHWYSQYSDNSQMLSEALIPAGPVGDVTLTLSSPTLGSVTHSLSDLLFDAGEVLVQMSTLNRFTKGEWIALGAAGAPVSVSEGTRFQKGEGVTVDGGRLGSFSFEIEDLRDPATVIPTWRPREYAVKPL